MEPTNTPAEISFEDFLKVDIRAGTITAAEEVPKSKKLLKLDVDFGPEIGRRQILAGIKSAYSVELVIGMQAMFVVNLAPREMMGLTSHGMILAALDQDGEIFVPGGEPFLANGAKFG